MASDIESLDSILNKATNPSNVEEDWEEILRFCDRINNDLDGPTVSVRLLAHKVQSPQEREALAALLTLETCVKNCGTRFQSEIGKFRFLNEIIKVVSPKYLGSRTSDTVKKRCIQLMYRWCQELNHEPKIAEAYAMLKTQGIVREDPPYIDKSVAAHPHHPLPTPPPRPKNALFEDEEKARLLSRLLKSKNPEDLQAANRLIKNMVQQDADRIDKMSKRVMELETINNSVSLLSDMLGCYSGGGGDRDTMKELYETLEKLRPNLFRLASDTEEQDNDGIADILKANDEVMRVMNLYKMKVDGTEDATPTLLDLGLDQPPTPHSPNLNRDSHPGTSLGASILDEQLLALGLCDPPDINPVMAATPPPPHTPQPPHSSTTTATTTLDQLSDIFGAAMASTSDKATNVITATATTTTTAAATAAAATQNSSIGSGGMGVGMAAFQQTPRPPSYAQHHPHPHHQHLPSSPLRSVWNNASSSSPATAGVGVGAVGVGGGGGGVSQMFPPGSFASAAVPSPSSATPAPPASAVPAPVVTPHTGFTTATRYPPPQSVVSEGQKKALEELDLLGKTLLLEAKEKVAGGVVAVGRSVTNAPLLSSTLPPLQQQQQPPPLLLPLHSTTATASTTTTTTTVDDDDPLSYLFPPSTAATTATTAVAVETPPTTTTTSTKANFEDDLGSLLDWTPATATTTSSSTDCGGGGGGGGVDPTQLPLSLSDVFVPLESIEPGAATSINAYDKDGVKLVVHFARNKPRPDVLVLVVSVMNLGCSHLKNYLLQVAVPKVMKVKLQPPTTTDLPPFNPILPPSTITQVMLLANPLKEKIRLKYKLSFHQDTELVTNVGEIVDFPDC